MSEFTASVKSLERQLRILREIKSERDRQDDLKMAGRFPYICADLELSHGERLTILMEEIGEACEEMLALKKIGTVGDARRNLKKELVQCGAVIVGWIEAVEKEEEIRSFNAAANKQWERGK